MNYQEELREVRKRATQRVEFNNHIVLQDNKILTRFYIVDTDHSAIRTNEIKSGDVKDFANVFADIEMYGKSLSESAKKKYYILCKYIYAELVNDYYHKIF